MYQTRPDLFPQGFLTDLEIELWGLYLEGLEQKHG